MKRKKKFAGLAAAAMALCLGIAPLSACSNNGGSGNEGGGDKPTVHTHSGGTATCLAKAVCSECGEAYGELAAHDYKTEKHDATCTEDGYTTETCSVCKDATTTVITAVGHTYGKTEEKATCTTDGVATYTCEACGDAYTEITTKSTGHTTKANAVWTPVASAPDANTPCLAHVVESTDCANCQEKITRNIDVHKPSYRATVTKVATCTQAGTIQYVCSCENPAYTYTEEIAKNANAHTWVPVTTRATATHECSECDATKTEVAKEGTTATVTAEELKGENVAIKMTDTQTTLQPDKALVEKMGGAEVKVETATASDLEISSELKEKIGDSPVYDFGMTKDGQKVDFEGGKMTVTVPYTLQPGEDPTAITVLYIDENGESHDMNAVYANGFAVFEVEHFSYYTVVRLTPAQRCAKIGHDYKDTVVAETCLTDGYTLQNCRRCGDHRTTEGKKATGHDYEAKVVKPTCTEKGYTIYTCKDCKATYIGDYVNETPHEYEDKVVAPTCMAKGYTEHTCKDCGKQYKDTYTAATGHKYTGGACSVCGAKDPSISDNFYFNLIESIDPTAGVYLDMSNVTFEYTLTGMNGGSGSGGGNKPVEPQLVEPDVPQDPSVKPMAEDQATQYVENNKVVINLYHFTFRIDENDNLEGKGEGKMTVTYARTQEDGKLVPQVTNEEVKLVIKDGKVYTFSKSIQEDESYTYYDVSPLSDGSEAQFKTMFEQVYTKELAELLTALQGQKSSPVNGAIAKVVEYIFTKEETNGGYTFTLNTDRVKEIITILTTESGNKVFDRVFGEGAYKETYDWIYALPKKTVAQLKTEVFGWLVKTGISEKALYAAVNSVVNVVMPPEQGGEPFDISAILTANGETTIAELIAAISNTTEMTAEALQTKIKELGDMLSDEKVPVADLVAQMAGAPIEGSVAEIVKAYESVINGLSTALKEDVAITFTTDKTGTFLGFAADFDQFEYTLDESVIGAGTLNIKLDGGMTLVPGGDFVSDVNTIVTKLDNALKTLDITEDKELVRYGVNYTLKKVGEEVYFLPEFNQHNLAIPDEQPEVTEATYNGVACMVTTLETYGSSYRLINNSLSLYDHCTPWVEYSVRGKYFDRTVFKVYISKAGNEVLGYEYDIEAIKNYTEQYGTSSFTLYYNTVTGEFAAEEQHKYELVDSKEAECKTGGEGYEKYRCTVCGETYTRTTYKSHESRQSIALKGTTCEEGIIVTYTCRICGEIEQTYETEGVYEDGRHIIRNSRTAINHDGCPNLALVQRKCLCGQFVEDIYVSGRCEFDHVYEESTYCAEKENRECEHGFHEHRKEVYRCAVTNCAYTYTVETYLVPTKTTCVYTYHKVITLEDKTDHTITKENYGDHDYRWTSTTEGLVEIEKNECQYCHKVGYSTTRTYEEITVGENKYKVLIRYYRTEENGYNSGYEREYKDNDPCHYVEYELDENGKRVGDGVPGINHKYSTTVSEEHLESDLLTITYHCQTCNETVNVVTYQVYEVNLSDGTTQQLERLISAFDERNDGTVREYNGCDYLEYYVQDGVKTDKICGEGTEHMAYIDMSNKDEYQAPTCTQYGHYTIHCVACDSAELVYISELGHYYIPEENGGYYCQTCGMHNAIEADGPISLESEVTADSVIVGYNDRFDRENLAIEIYVNNGTESEVGLALEPVVDNCKATGPELLEYYQLHDIYGIYDIQSYGECGVITIDKETLALELEKLADSGVEIKDVSVCVTVNGKHMPEDEYDDFIEQSVTFTCDEIFATEEPAPETPSNPSENPETPADTPVEVPVETPVEGKEEQIAA